LKSNVFDRLVRNWPAKVISLAAAVVIVLFNDLAGIQERYFTVPLELELAESVVAVETSQSRVRVVLRGEEEMIFGVLEDDIHAYADLTEHDAEGVFRTPVRIRKTGSALDAEVLEIRVEPLEVTVQLEEKLYRSLEVVPNLVGFPPPGYQLNDYRVSPSAVEVVGPRSEVEELETVLTEEIDLAGRREDFSERVRLVQPSPQVRFPGGDVIEFRGVIVETIIQQNYESVEIVVRSLDENLIVTSEIPRGRLLVQGRQIELEELPPDQVLLVVDASRITEPGTYTLPTRPLVPPRVLPLEFSPARLQITVVEATEAP
jgi:YbbR domain-containing protein